MSNLKPMYEMIDRVVDRGRSIPMVFDFSVVPDSPLVKVHRSPAVQAWRNDVGGHLRKRKAGTGIIRIDN